MRLPRMLLPLVALLMGHLSLLKDDDFPGGRLHPYVGVGPGLFISHVDGTIGFISNAYDTSVNIGADVRAGIAFDMEKNLALFTEYRFTHVAPDFSFTRFGATTDVSTTFNTHHFVIGTSFKF